MSIYLDMWQKIHDNVSLSGEITGKDINDAAQDVTDETKRLMKLAFQAGIKYAKNETNEYFERWIINMQNEEADQPDVNEQRQIVAAMIRNRRGIKRLR